MGIIDYGGTASIYGTDKNAVQISTIGKDNTCSMCRKKLQKGMVVVSKDSCLKFCIDCQPKLFEGIREELHRFDDIMKDTEADLKLNMEKYRTQNIASSI